MTEPIQADIAIVGAGPAGLMAAIAASSAPNPPRVLLLDQMPRAGLKLLATGGGRCNITNTLDTSAFLNRFGKSGKFMRPALTALSAEALRAFLSANGVATHSADGFHVFPESESAASVLDALLNVLAQRNVRLLADAKVKNLHVEKGVLRGLVLENGTVEAARVILATGGRSYEQLGSNGSGYRLAHSAGHTIIGPWPALVPLIASETWPGTCAGITIPGARIRIDLKGCSKAGATGDMLFTHRGLSGPAALDISGEVAALLSERESVPVRVSLAREKRSATEWQSLFDWWRKSSGTMHIRRLIGRYMPVALADILCNLARVNALTPAAHLPAAGSRVLAELMAEAPLTITDTEGFGKAMVTRGGVAIKEVTPSTMESRLLAGLYFAGETLDIDGPCGGFNLQWAFSSGHLAGLSASSTGPREK